MIQGALHLVRDQVLRFAMARPFTPVDEPANRIVLVRPDHFGDLLLLTPAIAFLRAHLPDHEIVLMTGPWNESVARHIAPEAGLVTWPFPGFDRNQREESPFKPYRDIARAAQRIREIKPRAILLLRDDHWWGAMMAREAGVPIRVGYSNPTVTPFLTHPLEIENANYASQNLEMVRRATALLGPASPNQEHDPDYSLSWPVEGSAKQSIERLLQARTITDRYVVIHPGTGAQVKTWPARRWAAVAEQISRRTDHQILLTGSKDEQRQCVEIQASANCQIVNLAGETTLFELGELFRGASIVLGVDSGPLHLAVATGTRSIHLYGPSDQVRYGPWGDPDRHRVLSAGMSCPSCGDLSPGRSASCGCMTAIQSPDVTRLAIELLHEY